MLRRLDKEIVRGKGFLGSCALFWPRRACGPFRRGALEVGVGNWRLRQVRKDFFAKGVDAFEAACGKAGRDWDDLNWNVPLQPRYGGHVADEATAPRSAKVVDAVDLGVLVLRVTERAFVRPDMNHILYRGQAYGKRGRDRGVYAFG